MINIDEHLRKITTGEQYHIEHPGELSKRYDSIPKVTENGGELYTFSFDSLLRERNIAITKESRFTWIPLHKHKVIEMNYIYSGQCTQIIDGTEVILHKGDVCLLNRNVQHEIKTLKADDIVITIDMRKRYLLDNILSRISSQGIVISFLANAIRDDTNFKQHIVFRSEDDPLLRSTIQNIFNESMNETISNEIIDAYMIVIFSQLLRIYKSNTSINSQQSNSALIRDILQYMETNFQTITLDKLAVHFGYNANYIGNYIKKYTGKTYKKLIIAKKFSYAAYFLINTDMPIYEIANASGYENLGFFYNKFRQIYGINPQEYRCIHQQSNQII